MPAALRWHRYYSFFNGDFDTVFTIHNLAHQGIFDPSGLDGWGFEPEAFSPLNVNSMEFYGHTKLHERRHYNIRSGHNCQSQVIHGIFKRRDGGCGLDGVIVANKNITSWHNKWN